MTILPQGKVTGAFPAPGAASDYGMVQEVLIAPIAASTGVVSVKMGAVVIRDFNKPPASGSMDEPLCLKEIDPTVLSVSAVVGGEGLWVTYILP